jgi:hypothetical protein
MRAQVNSNVKARDIPVIKYDDVGRLTLMAASGGFVMCRRPGCYPVIRTMKEWRSFSDKPWCAE